MRSAQAIHGLEIARSFLRPVIQVDRTLVLAEERCITWTGRVPGVVRDVYYPLEYQYLIDRGQYSFLLTDGSFLQVFYRFNDEDVLQAARLAYFPTPLRLSHRAEDLLDAAENVMDSNDPIFDHLYNWYEAIDERRDLPLNTSHFRFDYDVRATTHAPAHLQFGAMQEVRIPASNVPLPIAYLEVLISCLGCGADMDPRSLAHARNNCLQLARPSALLSVDLV